MLNLIAVFIGGGVGSILRFLVNIFFARFTGINLYWATFSVNVIGSLILGFVFMFFFIKPDLPQSLRVAMSVGFCGGLTTFSTFSLEAFSMIEKSQYLMAFLYVISSVIVCIISVFLGIIGAKLYLG